MLAHDEPLEPAWRVAWSSPRSMLLVNGALGVLWNRALLAMEDITPLFDAYRQQIAQYGEVSHLVLSTYAPGVAMNAHVHAAVRAELQSLGERLRCVALVAPGEGFGANMTRARMRTTANEGGAPHAFFTTLDTALEWVRAQPAQHHSVTRLSVAGLEAALRAS